MYMRQNAREVDVGREEEENACIGVFTTEEFARMKKSKA